MNHHFVVQIIKMMAVRGYTAKDLADKLNKPQRYVNAILSERKPITIHILAEITHALGCSLEITRKPDTTITAA